MLRVPGVVLLMLAVGCGGGDEPGEPGPAQEPVDHAPEDRPPRDPVPSDLPLGVPASTTGHLLLIDGVVSFLPCGADEPLSLRDGTGSEASAIVEELGYGEDRVLAAVVVEGGELAEVRYATPEGPGCEQLLRDEQIVAMGNEPFWSLRVDAEEVRWTTPEDMDGTVYRPGRWEEVASDRWVLAAERDEVHGGAPPDGPIRLELTRERCADTMAGARFPFSARVERGSRTYEGCAVEGRRGQPNR